MDDPIPRDVARALAIMFANWWHRQEAALAHDTGIGIGFDAICTSGLFDSSGGWGLTDLGQRALALAEEMKNG